MNSLVSIYSVPWDLTTTFRSGTANAPDMIHSVIHQLDDYHPFHSSPIEFSFHPVHPQILKSQQSLFSKSRYIMPKLNKNESLSDKESLDLNQINHAHERLHELVFEDTYRLINSNAPLILCGGEHGVGLGYLNALAKIHSSFSILHIDAHMDCRVQYFGFDFSHASTISHYSQIDSVSSISQVGIRDYSFEEMEFQKHSNVTFHHFLDYDIHQKMFQGKLWHDICLDISSTLTEHVFISLDVDGLMPYLAHNTGTPVPGGITYNQLTYLLHKIHQQKNIIGAELVEVNSINHSVDHIFGSRLLHLLAGCVV
tara:strand:- start:2320 stop:3255 length:936 start_codon:yes stop_codon:yes gene_type:complete